MSERKTVQFPDGKYTGEVLNGKREGFGKLEQSWGGTYEGHFKNNKKDGQGSMVVPGSRYEGQWKEDKRSGFGSKVWTNGRRYEGEWVNDEIEGQGRWRWGDGRFFIGKFKSDCPLQGSLVESDGNVYRVTFDGKTDIADSSLRPSTKVIADPTDAQSVVANVAAWERRLTAASKLEGLQKELASLEASTQAEEKAHEELRQQLEAATAESTETAQERDGAARASSEADHIAKEAEKVRSCLKHQPPLCRKHACTSPTSFFKPPSTSAPPTRPFDLECTSSAWCVVLCATHVCSTLHIQK
jgi:hypothetical protein